MPITAQTTASGSAGQLVVPLAGFAIVVLIVATGLWLASRSSADAHREAPAVAKRLTSLRDGLARETHPVVMAVIALLAALAAAVVILTALGLVTKLGVVMRADRPFDLYVDRHRVASVTHLMLAVTLLGSYSVVYAIAAAGGVAIGVLTRRWLPLVVMVAAILCERVVQRLLGSLVHGPKPPLALAVGSPGPYFSGGTARTIIACGLLAYFLSWQGLERRRLVMLWTGVVLLAFLECFSRLYLGRHFAVDIVGGWVAGLAILVSFAFAAGTLRGAATPARSPGPEAASAGPLAGRVRSARAPDRQGSHG